MAYHPYSRSQLNMTRLILMAGLILVAYMLYNLTVTVYENYQIDLHIRKFEEKNAKLRTENLQKLDDYKYYTSAAYIDKIAKQNLGLVNPGEEVVVLTEGDGLISLETQDTLEAHERSRSNWSNPQKWWYFFFEDNPFRN